MEIKILEKRTDVDSEFHSVAAFNDEGILCSKGVFRYRNTSFSDGFIKTLTAGGIATPVHLRRGGNVRKMFEYMHRVAFEDGVCTAILHPFSFAYYNMFGYEKVADHLIISCPIRYIDFVPRRCSLVPYTEDKLQDLVSIYKEFSRGRNLLLERVAGDQFTRYKDASIYVYYNCGKPQGYITYTTEKVLHTNHFEEGKMFVKELVYTTPEALMELMSFIRMYEGELEDVEFQNLAPTPEVDMILRNYTHTKYHLLPDISAKIINTEKTLAAMSYPKSEGRLSIKLPEGDEGVCGAYSIEWGGGDSRVKRLEATADTDVILTPRALARLAYGYDMLTPATLPYARGIEVSGNAEGLISVFSKKPCGVFEHF